MGDEAQSQGQNWPRGQRPNVRENSSSSVSFAHQCSVIVVNILKTNSAYLVIICYAVIFATGSMTALAVM